MPVDRAQARDRAIVVELRARLAGRVDDRARALDKVGDERGSAAAQIGVDGALQRIDDIVGGQLAPHARERRIVGEVDAGLHPDRPHGPAIGDRGRAAGNERREPRRRREVIPLVETLENGIGHVRRRAVVYLMRIERLDVRRGKAQDLVEVGSPGDTGLRQQQQRNEVQQDGEHSKSHGGFRTGCAADGRRRSHPAFLRRRGGTSGEGKPHCAGANRSTRKSANARTFADRCRRLG